MSFQLLGCNQQLHLSAIQILAFSEYSISMIDQICRLYDQETKMRRTKMQVKFAVICLIWVYINRSRGSLGKHFQFWFRLKFHLDFYVMGTFSRFWNFYPKILTILRSHKMGRPLRTTNLNCECYMRNTLVQLIRSITKSQGEISSIHMSFSAGLQLQFLAFIGASLRLLGANQ